MKIALMLAGQGTKVSEEVKEAWLKNKQTLKWIEQAETQLQQPIREWFCSDLSQDTRKAQLATYVGSMCMYQLYREHVGLYPSIVLGHSLGEITALTIAGAISYSEGLKLVDVRGTAMKKAIDTQESTGMTAVFASPEKVEAWLSDRQDIYIANYNSAKQTVIAGKKVDLQDFVKQNKVESVPLGVSGAFHTHYMQAAADEVYNQLNSFSFNPYWSTEVISNEFARPYQPLNIRKGISSQMVNPVCWTQSVEYAVKQGIQVFIDLSPNGMFVKMLGNQVQVHALHNEEQLSKLSNELKDDIEVNKHYSVFSRALGIIVSTKNNNEDPEAYENIVISGYNQIKSQIGKEATAEDIEKTLSLLELILRTKKVPEEQIMHYRNKLAWKAG
ncbi:ACP S-malonyltransferase [Paenibacillus sp. SAF-068]|uniref:ACP S-malonyltransferase n=1 Tax=Paenibacillus sp. SAF-068 TaxID=3436864 RepID=UPI003F7EC230